MQQKSVAGAQSLWVFGKAGAVSHGLKACSKLGGAGAARGRGRTGEVRAGTWTLGQWVLLHCGAGQDPISFK